MKIEVTSMALQPTPPFVRELVVGLLVALLMTLSSVHAVQAAPGDLDPTFDSDGRVTTDFAGNSDVAFAVAIQTDGKLVVAGWAFTSTDYDFALARYNPDGSLDSTFGSGGRVTTDFAGNADMAFALAIQADGKLVVAGRAFTSTTKSDFALARYNPDGSLDSTFGSGGRVTTDFASSSAEVFALVIRADGKLVVAGGTSSGFSDLDFALARYNSDGSLDPTFDFDGRVTTDLASGSDVAFALAIQADGKLVVAGRTFTGIDFDFALARYNSDGSLDSTFDGDGRVTTNFAGSSEEVLALAIEADGKLVVAGDTSTGTELDFALARYNPDGSLDSTFDSDGRVTTNFPGNSAEASALAIQADGKLVVAGDTDTGTDFNFALTRYNSDGSLDSTFGSSGRVTTDFAGSFDVALALAIQADGKLVAAGGANTGNGLDFALARYQGSSPSSELQVTIDIKPGGFPNSINLKSRGVTPVAILTTATFNATTVKPSTVRFGTTGTEAAPARSALEDVDGDGDIDMILHFSTQSLGIHCDDTEGILTGETFSGQAISGSDAIRTVCH